MRRPVIVTLAGLLLALSLTACGSDDDAPAASGDQTTTTAGSDFPVTLSSPAGEITLASAPQAIVSLSPTATESLFAIGAGDQVKAVDVNSNFPAEAPKGDLDSYEPNLEAIAAKDPDLVIITDDTHDLVKGLTALDIPVLSQPAPTDLDGVYDEIEQLGRATGHAAEAERVAADMRDGIEEVVCGADVEGLTYYYELDNLLYSQTSKTFLGGVLGRLGLGNIADGAGGASDYPQLSAEHILKADPDLILLADTKCCQQSAATLKARPGWAGLKAIGTGGVVEIDDDIASRWGPRLVELVEQVAAAAHEVAATR